MRKWTEKDEAELDRLSKMRDAATSALRKDIDQAIGFTTDFADVSKDRDRLVRFIASRGQALFDVMHAHYVRTPPVAMPKSEPMPVPAPADWPNRIVSMPTPGSEWMHEITDASDAQSAREFNRT